MTNNQTEFVTCFIGELTRSECYTPEKLHERSSMLVNALQHKFDDPDVALLKKAFIKALGTKDYKKWCEIHIKTMCGDEYYSPSEKEKKEWSNWLQYNFPTLKLK